MKKRTENIIILSIVLAGGIFYYLDNPNQKTSFAELSTEAIKPEDGVRAITLNRFNEDPNIPHGFAEITDPEEIEKFLATASRTGLRGSKSLSDQIEWTYSINFFHYTENLSVMTDGQTATINNTRHDALPDDNPVDFAFSYEIDGTDYFSEAIAQADFIWE